VTTPTRLLYGLHGHIPYDALPDVTAAYERYRFNSATRHAFETWFLPVYAWHAKNNIGADQLPELLEHFHRARLAVPHEPDDQAVQRICEAVQAGGTDWLTRKTQLATALSITVTAQAA
jgi:hypothetical protein